MRMSVTKALLCSTVKTKAGYYRPVVELYDGCEMVWRETHAPQPDRNSALDAAGAYCTKRFPDLHATARTSLNGKCLRRRGSFLRDPR